MPDYSKDLLKGETQTAHSTQQHSDNPYPTNNQAAQTQQTKITQLF
jgi:hypothetical protein